MSSDINSIFSFPGTGMDTDSDLVTIESGDSRYRIDIVVSDDSNHNVLTNSLGNTLGNSGSGHTLTGTTTPKIIGYVEDKENDAGIFFVYDSTPTFNHYIIRYNSSTDTFTNIIAQEPELDFPSDKFVDAGIIGNEDDQTLIWVHNSPPRSVNIAKAIAGGYVSYNEEILSFYKYPLISSSTSISAVYDTTIPRTPNKDLSNKIFQFALRLKYDDKSYSTLSHRSTIPFPEENIPSGRTSGDIGYDVIVVTVDIQNEPSVVDSYQLLYRIVDIGVGVPSSWNIYEEYPYTAKNVYNLQFKNDKSTGTVDDLESIRPYDYVPDLSNHVGIIDSNRAVFDVAQEGYDNVDIDVDVEVSDSQIPSGDEGVVSVSTNTLTSTTPVVISQSVSSSLDYYFKLDIGDLTTSNPYVLYTYGLSGVDIGAELKSYFDSLSLGLTIVDTSSALSVDLTISVATGSFFVNKLVLDKSQTFRTLKTGAKYKFGVEYGYNGKRGTVQTDNDCLITVPDISDLITAGYTNTNYLLNAEITLNHTAPAGATDFRFVSFGSNIQYFEEYAIKFNPSDLTDDASDYTCFLENNYTVIKKDDMINRMRLAYGDVDSGIDYGYDIQVGDIIKFIGYFDATATVATSYWSGLFYDAVLTEDLEYRVDVVTDTEVKLSSSAIRKINELNPSSYNTAWLIQIISKKDSFDDIAQEFSLSYPISAHGSTFDITEYFADVWKSKQVYINENSMSLYGSVNLNTYAWMEKPKISLYYDSYPVSQGRSNAVIELSEQKGYNKIRWGGKFIDDAGVNFMSRFESSDEKFLDDRNGSITVINQVGDTLKVYQERKVNSLYLKTTSADDPNGTSTFVFSDNVMSDPRQSVVDYGCTHFESYVRDVRNSFFFDLGNKTALIDTPGGIMSITDGIHKMHTYFSQKSAAIVTYGKDLVQVHGTYDDDLDLYVLSFVVPLAPTHAINDTVAFHIPSKRWITHFPLPASRPLEYYGRLTGKTMVSFVDSQLYLHNSNQTRNNFWGEQFDSEIWLHANESPVANKTYNSIEINSTGQWSCPDDDSIEITKPSLMRSRLVAGKFKIQEGIFRSEFLRNALNKALAFVRHLLLNGPILRGREMTIKLKNTDTTEAQLETVIVKSTISK